MSPRQKGPQNTIAKRRADKMMHKKNRVGRPNIDYKKFESQAKKTIRELQEKLDKATSKKEKDKLANNISA